LLYERSTRAKKKNIIIRECVLTIKKNIKIGIKSVASIDLKKHINFLTPFFILEGNAHSE